MQALPGVPGNAAEFDTARFALLVTISEAFGVVFSAAIGCSTRTGLTKLSAAYSVGNMAVISAGGGRREMEPFVHELSSRGDSRRPQVTLRLRWNGGSSSLSLIPPR